MQAKAVVFVRAATLQDAEIITDFQRRMAFETEDRICNSEILLSGVRNSIINAALGTNTMAYVLEDGKEKLIGFMFTNPETNLLLGGTIIWINSLYVIKDFRKKGVFKALYDHMLHQAKADPWVKAIRLYVETTNQTA